MRRNDKLNLFCFGDDNVMKRKLTILLFVLGLTLLGEAQAQAPRPLDLPRLQRDVEIMEMVLDRLLNREAGRIMRLGGASARGTYVPNFGVLFQIPNSSSFISIYQMHERAGRAFIEKKAAEGRGANVTARATPEARENLNDELWEFFSRYADAIGQLSDKDRIAVYSEGGSEFSFFFEIDGEQASSFTAPGNFFAWMTKGDLTALRAGKLSENEFRGRMHSIKPAEDNADIEIMSGIFDKLAAARTGTTHGLYVQDYGVIFFAEASFAADQTQTIWRTRERETPRPDAEAYQQIDEALRVARTAEQEREKNWQEGYKKFRGKIAEALADYGHTLRRLKPEDWLVVAADFRFAPQEQPRGLVCQIKKQQVDALHTGKISREQFIKSVTYFEN